MKQYFVDIDETLIFTKAKIHIIKNNKIIRKLSNREYNAYSLQQGESYDFVEFTSTKIFTETSQPNLTMIKVLEKISKETKNIALLTARRDFDDKKSLLKYLRTHKINVGHYRDGQIHIIRSGNITNKRTNTAQAKIKMIDNIVKKNPKITEIVIYDDCIKNLNAVKQYALEKGLKSSTFKVKEGNINLV